MATLPTRKTKTRAKSTSTTGTKEEWQTKEGIGHAKQEDGTEKRYLPKKAWEQMSEKEKQETDEKKQEESRGEAVCCQHVQGQERPKNTSKDQDGRDGQDDKKNAKDCTQHWEDAVQQEGD